MGLLSLSRFDVAVLGLGAMGSAAVFQLARQGCSVVGIDRHRPPHAFGSTHGETRITRQAIGEGQAYVPLVLRSNAIWRELEAASGERLYFDVGCLILSDPEDAVQRPARTGFLQQTVAAARRFGIAHELLDAAQIRARFPQFLVRGHEQAYFEPGGGYLLPERCVAVQLAQAERLGAQLRLDTAVLSLTQQGDHVRIVTPTGVVEAAQLIVSAGAGSAALLGAPFDRLLQAERQMLHWFEVEPAQADDWRRSPTYIWPHGANASDFFYGFPLVGGASALKVADEQYDARIDPAQYDPAAGVRASESAAMHAAHLAGRLAGVTPRVQRAVSCLYTSTPDSAFLIDRHPEADRVLVVSPCSGHGFKHSAAIGEAAAQWVLQGASAIDLSAFGLARFGPLAELERWPLAGARGATPAAAA